MNPPRRAAAPSFSSPEFRAALGSFATGVTIVTARAADGSLIGLTANSFNSVSLDPPLVLWSLSQRAGSMPVFTRGSHYAINILAADQRELAERFARKGEDRWAGVVATPAVDLAQLTPDQALAVLGRCREAGRSLVPGADDDGPPEAGDGPGRR